MKIENADELEDYLERLCAKNLLTTHKGSVSITNLAKLMKVDPSELSNTRWAMRVISKYNNLLCQNIKNAKDLERHLESLHAENILPVEKGRISVRQLAVVLGTSLSKIKARPWATSAIINYENKLKQKMALGPIWDRRVGEIERYLESLHVERKLPINAQGKLSRMVVLSHFGLPKNQSTNIVESRSPKLRELFKEYDKIILKSEYSRHKYDHLLDSLKKFVDSECVDLYRNRQINLQDLSEKICAEEFGAIDKAKVDTIKRALKTTPSLSQVIEEKENEINRNLRHGVTKNNFTISGQAFINLGASPLSEKHKRVFSFADIADLYSLEFAELVGTIFIHVVSRQESAKTYYSALCKFLVWLANEPDFKSIHQALLERKQLDSASFELAVLSYSQFTIQQVASETGKAAKNIEPPNLSVLAKFAEIGVFPGFKPVNHGRKRSRSRGVYRNPKPSMVEAKNLEIEPIQKIIKEAASYRGIEFDSNKDTIAFANTLAIERQRRNDLPANLVDAIAFLCDRRLQELRKAASKVFKDWLRKYELGRELLAIVGLTGKELSDALERIRDRKSFEWYSAVAKFFPKDDQSTALRNLLTLIEHECNGVCPTSNGECETYKLTHRNQFWAKQYLKVGGIPQSYLLPTNLAISAAACLYLCESGSNSAVALSLGPDCIRPSKLPRHVNIVSVKARSNGKSIFNDLPDSSNNEDIVSAAEALSTIIEATKKLRDNGAVDKDLLMVWAGSGLVKPLDEARFREDVKEIVKLSEELSTFVITPSMIRPTVLLHAQLKNPGNLSVANIIAQHNSETVTMGYVAKLPFRMILEERVRRFTQTIEVVAASRINDAHVKLGISEFDWKARIESAQKTGLGTYCANPFAGAQADFPSGKKCGALERCVDCSQLLVVADVHSIADMIIWREALNLSKDHWIESRLQRWESVWTPWLAFFEVVLDEKMVRGELALIKKKAISIAKKRKSDKDFMFPEPW